VRAADLTSLARQNARSKPHCLRWFYEFHELTSFVNKISLASISGFQEVVTKDNGEQMALIIQGNEAL
jgi:hypothetical protein